MPLDFTLEDHTLPNGLRVVVQPDDTTPTVTVNLWVGVGSCLLYTSDAADE